MRIYEISDADAEIVALVQYVIDKNEADGVKGKVSTQAFLRMAQNLGIHLSLTQLQAKAQQPPLSNMIADINDNEIKFDLGLKNPTMSKDKARNTVNSMAKRAMKR